MDQKLCICVVIECVKASSEMIELSTSGYLMAYIRPALIPLKREKHCSPNSYKKNIVKYNFLPSVCLQRGLNSRPLVIFSFIRNQRSTTEL